MASTTTPVVDVGALAGAIRLEASNRLASTLEVAISACADNGYELNQLQKIELSSSALDHFDGFERFVAAEIIDDLRRSGIAAGGLPRELADLLPDGDDA